jgi:hypothetical protein
MQLPFLLACGDKTVFERLGIALRSSVFGVTMAATGIVIGVVFTTLVSAHGGDSSLIHGCVQSSNGALRIVEVNEQCRGNERALDWNQQGLPGQTGPEGEPGAPGSGLQLLTDLNDLPCAVGTTAGVVEVSVSPAGAISLTCVVETGNPCPTSGCINFLTDPLNCGTLGNDVTDDFFNAEGFCANGQAAIGDCVTGWFNLDGQTLNGCEWAGDQDNDTFVGSLVGGPDCDDTRFDVNPLMPEIPNNDLDDDCDGTGS